MLPKDCAALDLISGLGSFLGMEVHSRLRKKKLECGKYKIINFRGGFAVRLDGGAAIPGAPVPETVFIVSAPHEAGALKG